MPLFQKGDLITTPQGKVCTISNVWKHPITEKFHCMLKDEKGKVIGDPEEDLLEMLMEE